MMTDTEKAKLAEGFGHIEEPEPQSPEEGSQDPLQGTPGAGTNQDPPPSGEPAQAAGEVVEADKGGGKESVPYDQLQKENEILKQGWNELLGYTEAKPTPENPDAREWNMRAILEEQGYDYDSLKKKGETTKEIDTAMNADPAEPVDPRDAEIKELRKAVDGLQSSDKKTQMGNMIGSIRSKYSDFKEHESDIARLVQTQGKQISSEADLELLYFAVKGQKSAQSQNGQTSTATSASPGASSSSDGSTVPRHKEQGKDPDEQLFEDIQGAGVVPSGVTPDQLQALTGKTSLAPMGND